MKLHFCIILISTVLLLSCKKDSQSTIIGEWADQKTEFARIKISASNGNQWLMLRDKKFKLEKKDNSQYLVEVNNREYPLIYDETSDILTFNSISYIRVDERLEKMFVGSWSSVNEKDALVFDIYLINGRLIWYITKDLKEQTRYYPKKTKEGFVLTYENQEVLFTIEEEYIVDSNGRKFQKSSS
ncbi:MAG: hypothetical protein MK076_00320 [Flavobacteriales bacterium]|nr:hypothetical protein [Flavobacteriales bacterium]